MITDRYWQWFDQQNLESLALLVVVALVVLAVWIAEQERTRKW